MNKSKTKKFAVSVEKEYREVLLYKRSSIFTNFIYKLLKNFREDDLITIRSLEDKNKVKTVHASVDQLYSIIHEYIKNEERFELIQKEIE